MAAICTIASLDHLVLTVASLPRTIAFYQRLGMRHEVFTPKSAPGTERHQLIFGPSKINLHQLGKEFEPKATNVHAGSADLCFIVEDDVRVVQQRLKDAGLKILEGGEVVPRTGARGPIESVYLYDPDGNLIE
ncbi:hypothetical protein VHUM_03309 [Vanrija humicola]|uniref:VOC domain-containing protein n=1 Tax=Vanrija humicola TaxID=5417 RepID=A0A7D8YWB0_VANHU|nr:hypothetical protein VHUM_03309 [Vanrija humicola]